MTESTVWLNKNELQQLVSHRLDAAGLRYDLLEHLDFDLCLDTRLAWPDSHPGTLSLMLPRRQWAIRDDDLKVLDALIDGLKAATPAALLTPGAPIGPAMVGVLAAVARLAYQAVKKGAHLEPSEIRLLIVLRTNPEGLTTKQIATILSRSETTEEAKVQAVLDGLARRVIADGSSAAFVQEDAAGRWHAAGV